MSMLARIDSPDEHNRLQNQPMDYVWDPPQAIVEYAADGTPIVTKRGIAGMPVDWVWGNVVDPATVQELVTVRNGAIAHEIYFYDKGDDLHAYNVLWLADPRVEGGPGGAYRPLTVRFIVLSEIAVS